MVRLAAASVMYPVKTLSDSPTVMTTYEARQR